MAASKLVWAVLLVLLLGAAVSHAHPIEEDYEEEPMQGEDDMEDGVVSDMEEEDDEQEDPEEEEEDLDEDEDSDDDDEDSDAPSDTRAAERRAHHARQKEAELKRLYAVLLSKFHALRAEIAGHVRSIMWRKFAWLRLLHARHRWSLLNKRYRHLIAKYRNLPKKQFLIKAYKRYTQSAEFHLLHSRKAFKNVSATTKKYLRHLHEWVGKQQLKIRSLRRHVDKYLLTHSKTLTKTRIAHIRGELRRRLRKEKHRLRRIVAYWRAHIISGRLPNLLSKAARRAQAALKKQAAEAASRHPLHPKHIPTPHPLVPFDWKKSSLTGDAKTAYKAIKRAHSRHHKGKKVHHRAHVNDWFAPLRERSARRAHRRRAHHHKGWSAFPKHHRHHHHVSARLRKWQNKIRGSFRAAWKH